MTDKDRIAELDRRVSDLEAICMILLKAGHISMPAGEQLEDLKARAAMLGLVEHKGEIS